MNTEWDPGDYEDPSLAELIAELPKAGVALLIAVLVIALLIVRFGA